MPLFVEELTKAIIETGEQSIPATLHDSLMARLDRVPDLKNVAQIAACIGREFDYGLLAQLAHLGEHELVSALDQLAAAELIFRRGVPPEATYSFKHALVRDAAYESLLKSQRQPLHGQIAVALERRNAELAIDEPEELARHHTAAGNAEAGAGYWERAGAAATAQSAFVEAINHYGKGLEVLPDVADLGERNRLELALQVGMGDALSWIKGFAADEVETAYGRATSFARTSARPRSYFASCGAIGTST